MIEKLKLEIHQDITFKGNPVHTIALQINPADFKEEKSIAYASKGDQPPQYKSYNQNKISLAFTIDGTGVISGEDKRMVNERIDELEKYLYEPYTDDEGRKSPYYVLIRWGRLFFKGRMEKMDTHYTLFKPNGEPLRAKVELSFVNVDQEQKTVAKVKVNKEEKEKIIVVKEGESLPLLCSREYSDPTKAEEVAKANNLTGLRELKKGQRLRMPAS